MGRRPSKPASKASPVRSAAKRQRKAPSAPKRPTAKPIKRLGRSRLTKQELENFRQLLLQKRAELMGNVAHLQDEALRKNRQEASGDLSNMPVHPADLGTDNWEQEFTLGLIENEQTLLREIEEALARIGKGTYGICLATNKAITKARLRATPWAKYCIEHARLREQGLAP